MTLVFDRVIEMGRQQIWVDESGHGGEYVMRYNDCPDDPMILRLTRDTLPCWLEAASRVTARIESGA